jgi:hypothetical protein
MVDIFKGGNAMRKNFFILGFILVFPVVLLVGCDNNAGDTVTITTDRDSYTPAMSSARGIKLTPNFETKRSDKNLVYDWETPAGEFVGLGKEVKNKGEAVIWSAIENDQVVDIKEPFAITLNVIDSENESVLATANLTITPSNGFYTIKK